MNGKVVTLPENENFRRKHEISDRKILLEHVRDMPLLLSSQRVIVALKKIGYMMTTMQLYQY